MKQPCRFICDFCNRTMPVVIIAERGTEEKIDKVYHSECWHELMKDVTLVKEISDSKRACQDNPFLPEEYRERLSGEYKK